MLDGITSSNVFGLLLGFQVATHSLYFEFIESKFTLLSPTELGMVVVKFDLFQIETDWHIQMMGLAYELQIQLQLPNGAGYLTKTSSNIWFGMGPDFDWKLIYV